MIQTIKNILNDWFTARNGVDYSLTKLAFIFAVSEMGWKFHESITTPDYVGFSAGIAGLMTAMAAKYYVEGK